MDIALVKVDGYIDIRYIYSESQKVLKAILFSLYTPVCLPSPTDSFYGSASVTTGWGLITPAHCTVPDICPPPPPEPEPMETDVLQVHNRNLHLQHPELCLCTGAVCTHPGEIRV